jgi:hypothetical protein
MDFAEAREEGVAAELALAELEEPVVRREPGVVEAQRR